MIEWDYTTLAATYDSRADYHGESITRVIREVGLSAGQRVADVGAGTGKLTKLLLANELVVHAIEPNDAMRSYGQRNTAGGRVTWSVGTGESTGLEPASVSAAFFGSSFNVVDHGRALRESRRILKLGGSLICMWNHRELGDRLQAEIERIIHSVIPSFDYGSRRESPEAIIEMSGLFEPTRTIEGRFETVMSPDAIIRAWRSHGTLQRQCSSAREHEEILRRIESLIAGWGPNISIPYVTRIFFARLKTG